MIEFYQAYADYHDLMDTTEEMLRHLAQTVLGTTTLEYGDSTYDLSQPFARISMVDAVLKYNPEMSEEVLRDPRSEEHTSELQSRPHLVCRLLLEKKKTRATLHNTT